MINERENHTMNMSDVGTSIGPRIRTLGLPLDRNVDKVSCPRTQLAVPDEHQTWDPTIQGPRLYRLNKGTPQTHMFSSIAYPDKSLFVRSSRSRFCNRVISSGRTAILLSRKSNTDSAGRCSKCSAVISRIWLFPRCNSCIIHCNSYWRLKVCVTVMFF